MADVFPELRDYAAVLMDIDLSEMYFRHEGTRVPRNTLLCDLTADMEITLTADREGQAIIDVGAGEAEQVIIDGGAAVARERLVPTDEIYPAAGEGVDPRQMLIDLGNLDFDDALAGLAALLERNTGTGFNKIVALEDNAAGSVEQFTMASGAT